MVGLFIEMTVNCLSREMLSALRYILKLQARRILIIMKCRDVFQALLQITYPRGATVFIFTSDKNKITGRPEKYTHTHIHTHTHTQCNFFLMQRIGHTSNITVSRATYNNISESHMTYYKY